MRKAATALLEAWHRLGHDIARLAGSGVGSGSLKNTMIPSPA